MLVNIVKLKSQVITDSTLKIIVTFWMILMVCLNSTVEGAISNSPISPNQGVEGDFEMQDNTFDSDDYGVSKELKYFYMDQGENDDAANLMRRGFISLQVGQRDKGLEELKKAFAMDSSLTAVGAMIAYQYLQDKKYEQSLEYAKMIQDHFKPWGYNIAGMAYKEMGEDEKAISAFKNALKKEPGYIDAQLNLVVMDISVGNLEEAKNLLHKVLVQKPGHLKSLLMLSIVEGKLNNKTKAVETLNIAIKENPEALEPRIFLARQLIHDNQPKKALEIVAPIRKQFANSISILEVSGRAELLLGNFDDAFKYFNTWLDSSPNDPLAHFYLSNAFAKRGEFSQALEEIEVALKLAPSQPLYLFAKAKLLFNTGDLIEAESLFLKLHKDFPESPSVAEYLGQIAQINNKPKEAIRYFEIAFNSRETNYNAIRLANAYIDADEKSLGLNTLIKWLDRYPNDILAKIALADFFLEEQKFEQAANEYQQVLHVQPGLVGPLNNLAWALLQQQKYDEGLEYSQQAFKLAPQNPQVIDTHAVLLLKNGHSEEAISLLRDAVVKSPKDMNIRFHFAEALVENGNIKEAVSILELLEIEKMEFVDQAQAQKMLTNLKINN